MAIEIDIETGQHAVTLDVGAQQMTGTMRGIPRREFVERTRFAFRPAGTRQRPATIDATRIECDGQPFGTVLGEPAGNPFGIADSYAAQHHALYAHLEQATQIPLPAHATAGLDLHAAG